MRWFRNNRRWLSRLAMLVLAFQLVTAFDHASAGHAASGITQNTSDDDHRDRQGRPDDCAACAVLHLAASAVLPDAVVFVVPPTPSAIWNPSPALSIRLAFATGFNARAPPQN